MSDKSPPSLSPLHRRRTPRTSNDSNLVQKNTSYDRSSCEPEDSFDASNLSDSRQSYGSPKKVSPTKPLDVSSDDSDAQAPPTPGSVKSTHADKVNAPGSKYCDGKGCRGNSVGILEHYGLVIGLTIICALGYMIWQQSSKVQDVPNITYDDIRLVVKTQHSLFKSQRRETWKTFNAVMKHVFETPNPEYPGVILLAGKESEKRTTDCLIRPIRNYFENHVRRKHSLNIDINVLNAKDADSEKIKLNDAIERVLKSILSFVTFENFEKVTPEAAMLFHAYCDNTNAPYKEVVYVLQVSIPDSAASSLRGRDVEEFLRNKWTPTLGEDKCGALLSRVANNIVIVEKESDEMLKSNC